MFARSNFGPTNKTSYSSNISLFSSNDNLPDQKVNNNSKRSRIESNVNENACSNDNFNNGPSTSKSFNSNRTTTHLVNSGLNGKKDNFPIVSHIYVTLLKIIVLHFQKFFFYDLT